MDLTELIRKAKKGDKEALLNLIMLEKNSYFRLAMTYMKNQQDAQDMLQDMIVSLFLNIGNLRDVDKFYSWSKTILVNLCKKKLLEMSRFSTNEEGIPDSESVEDSIIEDRVDIERLLSQLESKHQEVIRLRYFLDMDYSEIAQTLEIPLGTVKSRINAAMGLLRERVEEVH